MRSVTLWHDYEGPTFLVALAIYGGWVLLLAFHTALPWWAVAVCGAWLVAWHASLQHETIHALSRVPKPIRLVLALPPLGLFQPFGTFADEHRQHHRAFNELTQPGADPESYYHTTERWKGYPAALRVLYRWNQTLFGRLLIGVPLQTGRLLATSLRRAARGDWRTIRDGSVHVVLVAALLWSVFALAHMPWWEYLGLIAYPGASLTMLRSFYEHRWDSDPTGRTVTVENRFPFGLLFLNNNYHVVHHRTPSLPWYRIPQAWERERGLADLEHAYVRGYASIWLRWFFRPVFDPVGPPS